ncbi:G protein gamma subunit [Phycomyces blakesleeanus]|uniref:Guanine nucleotide-binding protein subunit gamma n=2 Tax=Phycomyces blakesleeanus TaxID=4837 RepID=A0A167MSS9_PHYB8|nr:G protein gamma subunit [Phycomyces blakesleeanus NRRL 1555(-)]OAD73824.1 G protein gamma subunit [Phycomyces blakesleeanus NRRL 1555(-)]|eukprot:XP_018291864.1 G protein gamma subunit [Phycomyces blakesleeanus NRRL 1555(-)]
MTTRRAQNISEAKLNRLLELNQCLREQLDVPRITVSSASSSLIEYCKNTKDPMVPSVWGPIDKKEDPFAPAAGGGCCAVM